MVAACHIKLPLYISTSSNVGVLGGKCGNADSGTSDISVTARLCVDSFATLFGSQVVGRLALILHGEAYRRSAEAHVKPRPQPACGRVIHRSEASVAPTPDDDKRENSDDCAEDFNHFFIYQGNRTRRVLSAPAGGRPGQQGAGHPEVHGPKVTLQQPKAYSSPAKRRSFSANSSNRYHSGAGQPRGEPAGHDSKSQVLTPELRLPEYLRQSEFNDSDKRSRGSRLMEPMSSRVPGPIAADSGNAALITDEIRLEVATTWGIPALCGICSSGGGETQHTCTLVDCLLHKILCLENVPEHPRDLPTVQWTWKSICSTSNRSCCFLWQSPSQRPPRSVCTSKRATPACAMGSHTCQVCTNRPSQSDLLLFPSRAWMFLSVHMIVLLGVVGPFLRFWLERDFAATFFR